MAGAIGIGRSKQLRSCIYPHGAVGLSCKERVAAGLPVFDGQLAEVNEIQLFVHVCLFLSCHGSMHASSQPRRSLRFNELENPGVDELPGLASRPVGEPRHTDRAGDAAAHLGSVRNQSLSDLEAFGRQVAVYRTHKETTK